MVRYAALVMTLAGIILSSGCQKKSTKSAGSAAPPAGTDISADAAKDLQNCNVDTVGLRLADEALEPIDASLLMVEGLSAVQIDYKADKDSEKTASSTLIVSFNPLASDTDPNYMADKGLIRILSDESPPVEIYRKYTAKYSEIIPLPSQYLGKKVTIEASACVEPRRAKTGVLCGKTMSMPAKQQAIDPAMASVNDANINVKILEDKMTDICSNLKPIADAFLKSTNVNDPSLDKAQQSSVSLAYFIANNPMQFAAICSSKIIDDVDQAQRDLAKAGSGEGGANLTEIAPELNLAAEGCNTSVITQQNQTSEADILAKQQQDCNAKDGYSWNSISKTCDQDKVAGTGPTEDEQKKNCDALSDHSWDSGNKICVKKEVVTDPGTNETDCKKNVGATWDPDAKLCKIESTDTSYFTWESALIPEYTPTACLDIGSTGTSITFTACNKSNAGQLFGFEKVGTSIYLKNKSVTGGPFCLKRNELALESASCSTDDSFKFNLIKKEYNQKSYYILQVASDITKCINKDDGSVKISDCITDDSYSARKMQLFTIKSEGGARTDITSFAPINYVSLVAERNKDGNKCLKVQDTSVSVGDCNKSDEKFNFQLNLDEYNNVVIQNAKKSDAGKYSCLDYTQFAANPTSSTEIAAAVCSDSALNQKFELVSFTAKLGENDVEFRKILVNSGGVEKCVDVSSSNTVSLADCKSGDYSSDSVRAQLFYVNPDKGPRGELGDPYEDKPWYDNFAGKGSDTHWRTAAGFMIAAGLVVSGLSIYGIYSTNKKLNKINKAEKQAKASYDRAKYIQTEAPKFTFDGSLTSGDMKIVHAGAEAPVKYTQGQDLPTGSKNMTGQPIEVSSKFTSPQDGFKSGSVVGADTEFVGKKVNVEFDQKLTIGGNVNLDPEFKPQGSVKIEVAVTGISGGAAQEIEIGKGKRYESISDYLTKNGKTLGDLTPQVKVTEVDTVRTPGDAVTKIQTELDAGQKFGAGGRNIVPEGDVKLTGDYIGDVNHKVANGVDIPQGSKLTQATAVDIDTKATGFSAYDIQQKKFVGDLDFNAKPSHVVTLDSGKQVRVDMDDAGFLSKQSDFSTKAGADVGSKNANRAGMGGAIAGLVAGVSATVLGGMILGYELTSGPGCSERIASTFDSLDTQGKFDKFHCELGKAVSDLAEAKKEFLDSEKLRDDILLTTPSE